MLAQEWFYGLVTRPDMVQNEHPVDVRFAPTVVNTKYGTIRKASFKIIKFVITNMFNVKKAQKKTGMFSIDIPA